LGGWDRSNRQIKRREGMNWELAVPVDLGIGWVSRPVAEARGSHGGEAKHELPENRERASLSRPRPSIGDVSDPMEAASENCHAVPSVQMSRPIDDEEFARLVEAHYESLYRFAFSLAHTEADARDLVQETFARLARKGGQLKSLDKAKSWLFTTLYRAYLDSSRHRTRHPQVDIDSAAPELPVTEPVYGERLDSMTVRQALSKVDEVFRVPLILFYLEQHSYLEIAEILNIPPGTVMSRISRGRAMLRRLFEDKELASVGEGAAQRGVVHE